MNLQLVRSALFVPGSRPERFAKALAAGADRVIVDFEDAVEESLKVQARLNLEAFLQTSQQTPLLVRVNMAGHVQHRADLSLCSRLAGVAGIVLPKAESAEHVRAAAATGKPVWPIIESAHGLAALAQIASVPGVERLTFGGLDLSLDLNLAAGTRAAQRMLDQARFALLVQSRLAGLQAPLDTVFADIADTEGLQRFAQDAQDSGFAGMLCIHPGQVALVHQAMAPSAELLAWAQRVVAGSGGNGAFQLDGQMIDAPVVARAQRLLGMVVG